MRILKILLILTLIFSLCFSICFALPSEPSDYTFYRADLSYINDIVSARYNDSNYRVIAAISNSPTLDFTDPYVKYIIGNFRNGAPSPSDYFSVYQSVSYPSGAFVYQLDFSSSTSFRFQTFNYPDDFGYWTSYGTLPTLVLDNNEELYIFVDRSISFLGVHFATYPKYSNIAIPVPAGYIFIWDRQAVGADASSVVSLKLETDVPFKKGLLSSTWRNGVILDYNNTSVQNIIDTASFYGSGNVSWNNDSSGGQSVNLRLSDTSSRYVYVVNPAYSVHNNNSYRNNTLFVTMCGSDGYSVQGRVGTYRCFSLTSELVDDDFSNYVAEYSASYLWAPDYDSQGKPILTEDGYAVNEGWKPASSLAGGASESWDDSTSTGQVIDNEVNVVPPSGGNNEVNFQQQVYNNYDLSGLFQYGNGSVQQVVNSGQGFFSFLSNLWTWLPPQVMSVIVSILTIFLIVGAVKLFL